MTSKKNNSVIIFEYKEISEAFVNEYYSSLDIKNENLYNLFDITTKMIFNNVEYIGSEIMHKINEIYNCPSKHEITNVHSMSDGSRAINIQVTGNLYINDNVYTFTQYFLLLKGGGKGGMKKDTFWIKNTMCMII